MSTAVKVGVIGGGLMGREVAAALSRWFVLDKFPVQAQLTAICDPVESAREWFRRVPGVRHFFSDYKELLASDVDVVYVAVPHNLHLEIYLAVLNAGKDLFAEKPFGIDLSAAQAIRDAAAVGQRFVRCSSEFPFLPGPQRAMEMVRSGELGKPLEARCGFWHSSDMDPTKPINWKRQNKTCGEIGVMGDLGMHVVHVPFALGFYPSRVYAQLQKVYTERPNGRGGMAPCDTWDNAMLYTDVPAEGGEFPMRMEMKRLAPGETNTWFFEALGTEGGVRYSTKEPKTLWTFRRQKEQIWQRVDLGSAFAFPTITGAIFEAGFGDCFLQMWAAYMAERAGALGDRLGCVTPDQAVRSHALFAAAITSQADKKAVAL